MSFKYSVILGNLGNTCDRFLSSGYKEQLDKATMLKQAASIDRVTGIELVGTWDIDESNVKEMKSMLGDNNLQCASIIPDQFSQKRWGKGSFSAPDKSIREAIVKEIKTTVDIAVEMNCDLLNIWPGQDGYDYPLCADYLEERQWFIDGVVECAKYAKEKGVKLALEYKIKEPRTHSYLARVADTIFVVNTINMDNVGICIDTGHAFMAYENVGESIALCKMAGDKLFHMHFNDNYSSWDDDMIVGSIRLVEYLEILYWLKKTCYQGWTSMDQYPYREDGYGAIRSSVLFVQRMEAILEKVGTPAVESLIKERDPIATSEFIRDNLLAAPR
ncbi:MAG: TIM barrel protein [Chitinivibrionales bacterium]|nr:TIM barrel protein [Chitinivibrionales bacterium]